MNITDKVVLPDREMNYCCFGTGEKTMVILPGISMKRVVAQSMLVEMSFAEFCERYTVYLFDRSILPEEKETTVFKMAEDTAAAITQLGLKDLYIYGVSQGGMMAMALAILHPELVKKLALVSTAAAPNERMRDALVRLHAFIADGKVEQAARFFSEILYTEETMQRYGAGIIGNFASATMEELVSFDKQAQACLTFDVREEILKIRCPILLLCGANDRLTGTESMAWLAEKLGADCYIYGGFGHAVYDEKSALRSRVYEFFEAD